MTANSLYSVTSHSPLRVKCEGMRIRGALRDLKRPYSSRNEMFVENVSLGFQPLPYYRTHPLRPSYPQPPAPNRNRNTKPEAAGALIHDTSCYVVWRDAVASDGGKMATAAALN